MAIKVIPNTDTLPVKIDSNGKLIKSDGTLLDVSDQINPDTVGLTNKADITYVDSALASKADTDYVDNVLNDKADITYVDNALTNKADITYVDNALNDKADLSDLSVTEQPIGSFLMVPYNQSYTDVIVPDKYIQANTRTYLQVDSYPEFKQFLDDKKEQGLIANDPYIRSAYTTTLFSHAAPDAKEDGASGAISVDGSKAFTCRSENGTVYFEYFSKNASGTLELVKSFSVSIGIRLYNYFQNSLAISNDGTYINIGGYLLHSPDNWESTHIESIGQTVHNHNSKLYFLWHLTSVVFTDTYLIAAVLYSDPDNTDNNYVQAIKVRLSNYSISYLVKLSTGNASRPIGMAISPNEEYISIYGGWTGSFVFKTNNLLNSNSNTDLNSIVYYSRGYQSYIEFSSSGNMLITDNGYNNGNYYNTSVMEVDINSPHSTIRSFNVLNNNSLVPLQGTSYVSFWGPGDGIFKCTINNNITGTDEYAIVGMLTSPITGTGSARCISNLKHPIFITTTESNRKCSVSITQLKYSTDLIHPVISRPVVSGVDVYIKVK